jgi:hypothetical protein
LFMVCCSVFAFCVYGQTGSEFERAKKYFSEADSLSKIDGQSLWGTELYGPAMFVFPESRTAIANKTDQSNTFVEKNGLYIGRLPDDLPVANTAVQWDGEKWTMINWHAVSQADFYSRNKLFFHECWHRIQDQLGIPAVMSRNKHLDALEGAVSLKLEMTALKHALLASETDLKTRHLKNALILRRQRNILFDDNNENEFEIHEGLPEYTGYLLCGLEKKSLPLIVARQIESSLQKEGFVNSFAYITGPAYCLLYDQTGLDWQKKIVTGKTLHDVGIDFIGDKTLLNSNKTEIHEFIDYYEAEELIKNEEKRFFQQKQLADEYKRKILDSGRLIIPNNNLKFSFNPQEKQIPVEPFGIVYKTMEIRGEWGVLKITDGVLLANDWSAFIVPAPELLNGNVFFKSGYDLKLNKEWAVEKIQEDRYAIKKRN